jgi:hypothetical protein
MGALVNDQPGPEVLVLTMSDTLQMKTMPNVRKITFFIFITNKIYYSNLS